MPPPERFALLQEHVVGRRRPARHHRRAITSATRSSSGGICDANVALRPDELTEVAGRRLRITLPEGIPGAAPMPNRLTLSVMVGPVVPVPVPQAVVDELTSVEVTQTAERDKPGGFQLTFNLSKPLAAAHDRSCSPVVRMPPIMRTVIVGNGQRDARTC